MKRIIFLMLLILSLTVVACAGGAQEPNQANLQIAATTVVEYESEPAPEAAPPAEEEAVDAAIESCSNCYISPAASRDEAAGEASLPSDAGENAVPAAAEASEADAEGALSAPEGEPALEEAEKAEEMPEAEATPVDNYFEDYGVNPFVDTSEDNLSTFALDVDTASYTVARRYVTAGNLPPFEAVRVEEFVNYFEQGYEPPADKGFAISADGALSPFHTDGTHFLRVGIQGYRVPDEQRKAASLTFVIDVSGSMDRENRLGLVKQSLQLLVDRLRPSDSVAIVVYGTEARLVLPPTNGEDRATILDAIYSLVPEDSTNVEAGLKLGYQVANQAFLPNGINRIILCSDGVANVGATGPDEILAEIRGYADAGITLTAIGFGMGNFNDVLMEQLANDGDGVYAYVDEIKAAERLFVDELTSTLQTIALDAKVQVEFNPEIVARYRLIGYENRDVADEDFRNDAVDAGEIGAGHSATAIYAVQLNSNDASGDVATINLRWQDPDSHQVTEISHELTTSQLGTTFDAMPPRYQLAVIVSQYAELLRNSPWAEGITLDQLALIAERLASPLNDADVTEFAELVRRASTIPR